MTGGIAAAGQGQGLAKHTGRAGVSPVLATAILAAVSIILYVTVALLMLRAIETTTEVSDRLGIAAVYALKEEGGWTVVLNVENTGAAPVTVEQVFVDDVPVYACGGAFLEGSVSLEPGGWGAVTLKLQRGGGCGASRFVSGAVIRVKLLTARGGECAVLVTLP
ncbi:MAG: hypothetical protein QXW41_07425 [Fervidicoccaceae archaeon]